MFRRKSFWIVVGALVLAALVAVNLARDFTKGTEVELETVERRPLRSMVTASGILEAHLKVDVSANTQGKVVDLKVAEGDRVRLGDVLLVIDPVPYRGQVEEIRAAIRRARAELAGADASLAEAQDNAAREEQLAERGVTTKRALDAARREVVRAEAAVASHQAEIRRQEVALETAKHNLDQVTVSAEIDGVVTRLNVEEGENVVTGTMNNPGTVLLTIADLSRMEVELEVDETDVVHLALGLDAEVRIDAFPDTVFAGRVTEIGHAPVRRGRAGESSADFEVVVELAEVHPGLRPGLSAAADVVTAERDSALAVSIGALVYRDPAREAARFASGAGDEEEAAGTADEEYGVYVVAGGRARFQPVRLGITGERHFEVLDGLGTGDEVIVGPFAALRTLAAADPVRVKHE